MKNASRASKSDNDNAQEWSQWRKRLREGFFLLVLATSAFCLLALGSYHASDPGWSHYSTAMRDLTGQPLIANAGGEAGAWCADVMLFVFGYLAFLLPFVIVLLCWRWCWVRKDQQQNKRIWRIIISSARTVSWLLVWCAAAGLLQHWLRVGWIEMPSGNAGALGTVVFKYAVSVFNIKGANLVLVTAFIVGITLATGMSWLIIVEKIGQYAWVGVSWIAVKTKVAANIGYKFIAEKSQIIFSALCKFVVERCSAIKMPKFSFKSSSKNITSNNLDATVDAVSNSIVSSQEQLQSQTSVDPVMPDYNSQGESSVVAERKIKIGTYASSVKPVAPKIARHMRGKLPNVSLLDEIPERKGQAISAEVLEMRSRELEEKMADFSIKATVVAVHPGPVITRFEVNLAAGTKVSKIAGLAKDLARSLSVMSVRVVEVIQGKSVIGIELPNEKRENVYLREALSSQQFVNTNASLPLALGKDIAGHPVVVDLAKMPHLLVAGTTGSGKSVSLNAMLLSLLYRCSPDQLRIIMIDPKMLELAIYDGIPHLLVPVVTDMKEASNALRWCVVEMERRYRLMATLGVRNLAGFNAKLKQAQKSGQPIMDPFIAECDEPVELEELPQIVILADEFADMMMVVGKKVETLIARLAQKARAAGIHLILATQRPSVDVITGLIKANVPTRIAFQVSSRIDSRTILDQQGAEQLLGHGDMLYLAPGTGVPVRVHGAYVSDDEVHRVVRFLRETGKPNYVTEILTDPGYTTDPVINAAFGESGEDGDAEQDPLYDQAVEWVVKTRRASVSSVQRRFKIGYNRASRIVEAMEVARVVSPMEQSGLREVLAPPTSEQ